MLFRYKARDRNGVMKEGRLEAEDRGDALKALQGMDLLVVSLAAVNGFALNREVRIGGPRQISSRDLAIFCGQFASLAAAGIPVVQSLSVLARQFRKRPLAALLDGVIRSVQSGSSLSQALREHQQVLPSVMIYITSVAEVSGSLDTSYALLATYFEQEENFSRKLRSAFTYPAVVLGVALIVIIFMVTVVLPTYANLFAQMGAQLPASTRFLMAFGNALKRYWYLVPVILLGLVWLVRWFFQSPGRRGAWQRLMLRVPVFGPLTYMREMARFARTLGTMSRSGIPLLGALLTIQQAIDHQPFKQAIAAVQEDVRNGDTFGQALERQPIFDRISVEVIGLGEAAGNLDAMLFRVADLTEKDLNTQLDRMTQILEPALTVLLGGIVVGILLPMLLPMFEIFGQIR